MAKRRSVGLVVVLFVNKTTIKERAFRRGKEGALGQHILSSWHIRQRKGGRRRRVEEFFFLACFVVSSLFFDFLDISQTSCSLRALLLSDVLYVLSLVLSFAFAACQTIRQIK